MVFKYYNILLNDGTFTVSPNLPLLTQLGFTKISRDIIEGVFPDNGYIGKTLIDVGCLEGGYTLEFAKMGIISVGLEVRESNFEKCCFLADSFKTLPLKFIKDDCWNIEKYGKYDIVFVNGLLYHLDNPNKFIGILANVCKDLLILDTNVSNEDKKIRLDNQLSDIFEHEGMLGRWYKEFEDKDIKNDKAHLSSWENKQSFWPTIPSLLKSLKDAGFTDLVDIPSKRNDLGRVTIQGRRTQPDKK